MRLEAIDARHSDTVALLRGPLVLMAVKRQPDDPAPRLTRQQLLSARRVSQRQWESNTANGPITMLPYTSVGDQPYTTYVRLV